MSDGRRREAAGRVGMAGTAEVLHQALRMPREERARRHAELRAIAEARTPQGHIGVKVWVHQGDYLKMEADTDGHDAQAGQVSKKPKRSRKR